MLFNSIDFALFLPLVFAVYWLLPKSSKWQNALLLVASYVFYGWWDYRFLSLILFSTLVDFTLGILMARTEEKAKRKQLLYVSFVVNFGLLGFFKYFNFFEESLIDSFRFFGQELTGTHWKIILPVGISFYTFQTLSYTIDIYKQRIQPVKNITTFATFVSFFPQLVAGPIERAEKMIPQLLVSRKFSYTQAKEGAQLMVFGFFRKMVIADNLGIYIDRVWEYPEAITPQMVVIASIFFSVQIYMDFSGYSRIARGVAKLFGVDLMVNFNYPYKAKSFAEFWSRWHISLSTWFRDYLYIPLGGNRKGRFRTLFNLCIVFSISGLWHGADWSFLLWGFLHFVLLGIEREIKLPSMGKIGSFLRMVNVLVMVNLTWILFRAPSISDAFVFIGKLFEPQEFIGINSLTFQSPIALALDFGLVASLPLLLRLERKFGEYSRLVQTAYLVGLIVFTCMFYSTGQSFIYFQF